MTRISCDGGTKLRLISNGTAEVSEEKQLGQEMASSQQKSTNSSSRKNAYIRNTHLAVRPRLFELAAFPELNVNDSEHRSDLRMFVWSMLASVYPMHRPPVHHQGLGTYLFTRHSITEPVVEKSMSLMLCQVWRGTWRIHAG